MKELEKRGVATVALVSDDFIDDHCRTAESMGIPGLPWARLAAPLAGRFGQHRILVAAGTLRAPWSLGLAFLTPGTTGLLLVIGVELGLVLCCGVFNPVCATHRLERTATDRLTRTLSAWAVTTKASTALLTALWGVLGTLLGPRTAVALAGALLLTTPLLLPRPPLLLMLMLLPAPVGVAACLGCCPALC